MRKSFVSFLILLAILIQPSRSQKVDSALGWDLTYTSVLEKNGVDRSGFLWKWLNFSYQGPDAGWQTPARKWLAEWQGEPIVSSILIEFPAFHAAEHTTVWLARTQNGAHFWQIIDDATPKVEKQTLPPQAFDDIFAQVSSWQQSALPKAENLPAGIPPEEKSFRTGHIGFLSLYGQGESRQMLLNMNDFMICNGKICTPESKELESGRVLSLIVNIPEDPRCAGKNIKPKSNTEITAMTPHQLVDELIKSSSARYDNKEMPAYITSIEMKIRKSGKEILPVLTEYIDGYEPQSGSRCEANRFHTAERIAYDIDRFEFRVRGSKEGQQTIEALERGIRRIDKFEEYNGNLTLFLDDLKGINFVDRAIQDTFWVNKKIKLSDIQLLLFTNFLIARDPAYPTWSGWKDIKDYSRINKYGNPLQVSVLTTPKRFYDEYSEFIKELQKTTGGI